MVMVVMVAWGNDGMGGSGDAVGDGGAESAGDGDSWVGGGGAGRACCGSKY